MNIGKYFSNKGTVTNNLPASAGLRYYMMPTVLSPRAPAFELSDFNHLRDRLAGWSASTAAGGDFPHREFTAIRDAGLLSITLPGAPLDQARAHTPQLLQLLQMVGYANLAVGRIYEGHINALKLIQLFGTAAQQGHYYADARAGHLFGVWNTQMNDGIHLHSDVDGTIVVSGSKSFCSGSVHVTRPIISGVLHDAGGKEEGWQLAVVPLDRHELPVDKSFWQPLGMRNSVSYKIDFTGIRLAGDGLLGRPEDYNRQPYLSGGAIRFAAVQLGGAEFMLDATRDFLSQSGRTDNPYQLTRLGQMAIRIEAGRLWLQSAGRITDECRDAGEIVHYANMTRTAIADHCSEVLQLAESSVGARGMLEPHPFARLLTDLTMYLRQPAPDATLEAVGQYFCNDDIR